MPSDREQLLREYREYDAKVDIVSCFEVFSCESTTLPATVAHFERFPRYRAPDREIVTPDFTVLFNDGTLLVGEISKLARSERSLKDLLHQIGRYDTLIQAPGGSRGGGGHELADVEAVDVLVVVPDGESNAAIDRINQAIEERRYGYAPRHRPTVMGWSFDAAGSRYIYKYDDRSNNPRLRTHGRHPSLTSWLQGAHDTLACAAERLAPLKVRHRFMNDRPPGLYMATILWLDALPAAATPQVPPVDLEVKIADLAAYLRQSYGWGDVNAVRIGLEFLQRGGLARQTSDSWAIELKEIASSRGEVHTELLRRHLARPTGPVTAADREQARTRGAQSGTAHAQRARSGRVGAPNQRRMTASLATWHDRVRRTRCNDGQHREEEQRLRRAREAEPALGRVVAPLCCHVSPMPDRTVRDFPLFPLALVALPHELVPLHIFEERYRIMFDELLEQEGEFGIVWLTESGTKGIGCACEIESVLERMDDGRLNVLTRGTRPFRIVERQDDMPYPAATVEFLSDKEEATDERAAEQAREAYAQLVVEATDHEPDPVELADKTAYEMAATVDFGLDAKQGLLDLRSENARMRLVTRLFRAALKRLDFVERAQARARSNGKVRFG